MKLADLSTGPDWVVYVGFIIFAVLSIVLISGHGSWLISGYNTASKEEKAKYNEKKKEVLIVSRLEEEPKRISLALKIWKEIETDHTLSEWKLKIVGHGKMESWYKSLVIHYGLQRVFFEGTKNPETYYNEASIFMMTSSFEGWGLTLTEAQQYGCVPLAFHSFASLTDIITDKVNGFAIPNDDISLYIKQMKLLMTDEKLRKSMSANAIESSKQFSIEIIIKKWMEVINE